jgi:hypothetical protein
LWHALHDALAPANRRSGRCLSDHAITRGSVGSLRIRAEEAKLIEPLGSIVHDLRPDLAQN